jgi:hypothetical protein
VVPHSANISSLAIYVFTPRLDTQSHHSPYLLLCDSEHKNIDSPHDVHPVTFYSHTLLGAELNYNTHDKELCDGIGQGQWSDMVQRGLRMRRKLGELLIEKKLACMPAGVVSPGTQSCANDKGPPRKEVGG